MFFLCEDLILFVFGFKSYCVVIFGDWDFFCLWCMVDYKYEKDILEVFFYFFSVYFVKYIFVIYIL